MKETESLELKLIKNKKNGWFIIQSDEFIIKATNGY